MRILILAVCCLWCGNAVAGQAVGTVTFVEGIVDVLKADGTQVTVGEGYTLELGQRLRTKSYSKAAVALADKSVLKIAPSSCLSVETLELAGDGKRQRCLVRLSRGKAEAVVAKTGAPETFVIETPNARGAVRGSDIFVSYLAGKSAVFVSEGRLAVVNPAFPDERRIVSAGGCLFVDSERAPEQPRQAMKAEMAMHRRDVEPELARKWVPAQDSLVMNAVVTSLKGAVRLHRVSGQQWQEVSPGETVAEGDTLQTAADGSAEVRLGNGNVLFIEPSTELLFRSLRQESSGGAYHNEFEVSEGEVLAVVEKISGESTFQVRTPSAVSGVRGTVMRVVVEPPRQNMPAAQTRVFFEGGRGDVTSLSSGSVQQLMPGQNVRVDSAGAILQPQLTSAQERTVMLQPIVQKQMAGQFFGPKPPPDGAVPMPLDGKGLPPLPPPPPGGEAMFMPVKPPFINPDIWYRAPLGLDKPPSDPAIVSPPGAYREITLKNNGSWNAIFNGFYTSGVTSPWTLGLSNLNGDSLLFTGIDADLPVVIVPEGSAPPPVTVWTGPVGFSGQIQGTEPDRNIVLKEFKVVVDPGAAHVTVDARGEYNPL